MKNGNVIQNRLLNAYLYKEVVQTAEKIRDSHDYDLASKEQRETAVLCYALQASATHTVGTSLTLAGVYRALKELQDTPAAPARIDE